MSFQRIMIGCLSLVLASFVAPAQAAPTYSLGTLFSGSGVQQFGVNDPIVWNFTPLLSIEFAGANLEMKRGNSVTQPAIFSLYKGSPTPGNLVNSVSVNASSVDQSPGLVAFIFAPGPEQLLAGTTYVVTLTSNTPGTNGNNSYFVKPSSGSVADGAGNPAPLGEPGLQVGLPPASTTVPEPTSLALVGAGLAGLGAVRRRRKAA